MEGKEQQFALLQVQSPGSRPSLADCAVLLAIDVAKLDVDFGVVELGDGYYTVRIRLSDVPEGLPPECGPFSDPEIGPFGPPQ